MVRADFHTHSHCSFDGRGSMDDMCLAALEAGLDTICFTEHCDFNPDYPLDVDAYLAAIDNARNAFPQLTVLRGIEAGYSKGYVAQLKAVIDRVRPDYLLLSCHSVEGVDPYKAEQYYKGRTRREGNRAYLAALLDAMEDVADFDALAHIGYAGRYAPPGETAMPLVYGDAPDLIDRILSVLIDKGRALEVNTSQTASGGAPIPDGDILRRYFKMGGRMIVLGSDAHEIGGIAAGFGAARELLLSIGFSHYATYQRRERTERPL